MDAEIRERIVDLLMTASKMAIGDAFLTYLISLAIAEAKDGRRDGHTHQGSGNGYVGAEIGGPAQNEHHGGHKDGRG